MAITTAIRIEKSANSGIPSTYVPTTLPTLANKKTVKDSATLDPSLIENATVATAITNLTTALQTELTNNFYDDTMHFDTADTIAVNITVTKIERTRTDANDLKPATDVYVVDFICDWSY